MQVNDHEVSVESTWPQAENTLQVRLTVHGSKSLELVSYKGNKDGNECRINYIYTSGVHQIPSKLSLELNDQW